ncbi:hypothetical protein [Gordonia soli]|uniref:Uncharacterized protein n=1 Tax=Gordonia soli NBRC 108243 TaxID=1223545 RepID=M0QRN3_9ACTN|nr:hypothetical protein [Gordonia soli]GAC71026.1 hypothetical protein GS4_47_00160 [Gordonia soli NBRC 108243]
MGFYEQSATILRPAKKVTRYNPAGEELTYDLAEGAQRIPIAFGVDVQPRTEVELDENGTRIATKTVLWLCTPDGCDLDVRPTDRIGYGGVDLDISGEVHRWPSDEYESGVDHVSVALEHRNG